MSREYFESLIQREEIFSHDYLFGKEAFEITGRWIFGADWTGYEEQERPLPSPSQALARRQELEDLSKQAQLDIVRLQREIGREIDGAKIRDLQYKQKLAFGTRNSVAERLIELDEGYDPSAEKVKTPAQRRQYVERLLYKSLQDGQVRLFLYNYGFLDRAIVRGGGYPFFHFDFAISVVIVPKTYSSRRRHQMLFPVSEFRDWLGKQSRLRPAPRRPLQAEDRCKLFLEGQSQSGQRRTKESLRKQALREIAGLSARTFDRVWSQTVPAEWRVSGRPKSTG